MPTENNSMYIVASRDTTRYSIKVITSSEEEAYEVWSREYPKFKRTVTAVDEAILLVELFDLTNEDIQILEDSKADIEVAVKNDSHIQHLIDDNGDCLEYYEPEGPMNETTYVYIVHSDINENNIYAEFATEEDAIDYARRHKDELTYVDKVEVALDEDGDIIDEFDSITIWVYDEEDEDSVEEDDEFFAFEEELVEEDFDALVETLEENEDVVECKECFELFPKVEGIKVEHGYICPHCHQPREVGEVYFEPDFEVADEDTFKIDFPDCEKFSDKNDMIPEEPTPEPTPEPCVGPECEAPVEAPVTKEEVIDILVRDEEDAIAGYDNAEDQIDSISDLPSEEKEEIKDVLDHIREEEIEHIEELEELSDEVEEPEILEEHINEEHPAIESDQELEGTDNAVVKCEVADVITHSEDEKPVDCEGEKKPLEKPLTESSLVKGNYEISPTEHLSWGWDKGDTFYVVKNYRASENEQLWNTEFRKTYANEEDARRAFNYFVRKHKKLSEETHARYAKPEGNRVQAYNNALKYAKKDNKPYIYGYSQIGDGKFFALEQPIKVSNSPAEAEKEFRNQYKRCATVYVAYPDKDFIKE
jgi:hypothetical protein